jgi:molybdopterin-guanine dinucleotide biosynthesis protein A
MMGGMKRKIRCAGKPMTVLVLAGGRGSRMKADKASLDVGGTTLLAHVLAQVGPYFDEVLVSVSPGQDVDPSITQQTRIVPDETPGLGPIGGLQAGLRAAGNDACAVVACDIPDVPVPFLRALARAAADFEIAVPKDPAGHFEPLFAVYKRSVSPAIEALLAAGERSLLPLYEKCRTAAVRMDSALRLPNLNTRADYEAYLRSTSGRPAGRSRTARRQAWRRDRRSGAGRRSPRRG